jgi:hypothetical protein
MSRQQSRIAIGQMRGAKKRCDAPSHFTFHRVASSHLPISGSGRSL